MDTSLWDPTQRLRSSLSFKKIVQMPAFDSTVFRVLVLSSSPLLPHKNDFNKEFIKQLNRPHVKIFNISFSGKTALQNYYEYKLLSEINFNFVLLYQGANEFKKMWDHNFDLLILNHPESIFISTPLALHYLLIEFLPGPFRSILQPETNPFTAFKGIISLSNKKKEKLVVATFAKYITEENSWIQRTDSAGQNIMPVNYYNNPNVINNKLDSFNRFILNLSSPYLTVIDADKIIPKEKKYFLDWCHFTKEGTLTLIHSIVSRANN